MSNSVVVNESAGSSAARRLKQCAGGGHLRMRIMFLALAISSLAPATVIAEQVVRREYAIKAGVIGVLANFVSWPAEDAPAPGEPLAIGILGKDPFIENGVNQLDRMTAEAKRSGRILSVKRFKSSSDYQPCHILFVSSLAEQGVDETVEDRLTAAKKLADGNSVLLIGDSAGLAREGAAANLVFDPGTNLIRLEVNPDAAARAGLKLAPDLLRLKLVQIVRER